MIGIAAGAALAVVGLVAGIGITAIGPGGVLVTIGLVALTALSPAEVAGTAMITNVATGIVGTIAFARSRHLASRDARRAAALLSVAAIVGAPLGVLINGMLSASSFQILLAVFVAVVAILVLARQARGAEHTVGEGSGPAPVVIVLIGFLVAIISGIFGVGGPMLAVPLLLVFRMPLLTALAAAQVQSIVIAAVGSVGYAASGSIDLGLAALIGVPELLGVVLGWIIARRVSARVLAYVLAGVLLAVAPYLVWRQ